MRVWKKVKRLPLNVYTYRVTNKFTGISFNHQIFLKSRPVVRFLSIQNITGYDSFFLFIFLNITEQMYYT